jgi:hypothetical protein
MKAYLSRTHYSDTPAPQKNLKFRSVKEIANLENDTSRFKWDFHLFGSSPLPVQDFFHICLEDLKIITIPNCRFQQISDGVGQFVCTHTHTHTVINPKYWNRHAQASIKHNHTMKCCCTQKNTKGATRNIVLDNAIAEYKLT